jgi:hypothetical protein
MTFKTTKEEQEARDVAEKMIEGGGAYNDFIIEYIMARFEERPEVFQEWVDHFEGK